MFQMTVEHFLLMLVLVLGYTMIVFVRESVSYSAPYIAEAEQLSFNDLGLIVSSQKLGYTIIKVVGGSMVDVLDPGVVFISSVLLSGLSGMVFTAFSSVTTFSLTWFLSGLIQGPSWPACAVLMRKAFRGNQFATWWSILSASTNLAAFIGPLVSQTFNSAYPWRVGFLFYGSLSIIVAVVGGLLLLNLQPKKTGEDETRREEKDSRSWSLRALLNPIMLVLCFDYFLLSVVRGACCDWGQHYLMQEKKQSVITGGQFISSLEIGGMVGSIMAGYMSDAPVSKDKHQASGRLKTQLLFSCFLTVCLSCLIFNVHSHSSQIWLHSVGFFVGFSVYGCINIIGILCLEVSPSHLSGTAVSMATLAASAGRVVAGYPLTVIASYFSWHQSFMTALLVSLVSLLASAIVMAMVNHKHKMELKDKKL